MQLVITSYGSYLRKSGDCFMVKTDDRVFEVSSRKVDSIMIATSAYLSTDALKMAVENNIDVIFLDEFGDPFGRVWHSRLGSTVLIRRKQLEAGADERGFKLALEWVRGKLDNQHDFLERLSRPRPDKAQKLKEAADEIRETGERLSSLSGTLDERRGTIMALEGKAGKIYFDILSFILPQQYRFEGRSRNPAADEFNALLNYGYGVLYSLVEKACIIAGLDPYVGFLHTDNYNKKSLVFDLIEPYRIFAEEPVVHLFSGRKVKVEHFEKLPKGYTLAKEGKALLIEALNRHLDESIRYRGRNIQRRNTIQFDCHRIANGLIK
jgi:CRISPR-associated protein Cas1